MKDLQKAEALLEIIRDELNVKQLLIFNALSEGISVQVIYKDGHLRVYKNNIEQNAPRTAVAMASKWLEGLGR